jgi:hypothetical protein
MGDAMNVSIALNVGLRDITNLKMGIHRCSRYAAFRALFNTKRGTEASSKAMQRLQALLAAR